MRAWERESDFLQKTLSRFSIACHAPTARGMQWWGSELNRSSSARDGDVRVILSGSERHSGRGCGIFGYMLRRVSYGVSGGVGDGVWLG